MNSNPGVAYLAGRRIEQHPGVQWIPVGDLDDRLRAHCFPTRRYRGDGGWRSQREGGFPDDVAGILRYSWQNLAGDEVAIEVEGITADGERRDYTTRDGDQCKRPTMPGNKIGAAAFVVRLPRFGGRLHVCEGAIDALSVDPLGLASPIDGIIAAHGCHGLPKLEPWCSYAEIRIYPHHLDRRNIGERCAEELAAKLNGRAVVIRSEHDERHDLNDELTGAAPRRSEEAGPRLLTSGAEWMRETLLPDAEELVPPAPGFLYAQTPVVCHADRGAGKSTYAAFVASEATKAGLSVVLIVDDDPGTWARRLRAFGALMENVQVGRMRTLDKPGALEAACSTADVVILDSWRRWAQASGLTKRGDLNDESRVGPVADRICNIARAPGVPAFVVLANEAKAQDNNSARGSVALEDAVDAVRTIARSGNDTIIRTSSKARERIPAGPWTVTLGTDGFTPSTAAGGPNVGPDGTLVDPKQDRMDESIRDCLVAHPEGVSQRQVRDAVNGRGSDVSARLRALAVRDAAGRWRLPAGQSEGVSRAALPRGADTPDTPCRESVSRPMGQGADTPDTPCPESVSHPIGDTGTGHASGTRPKACPEVGEADTLSDCKTCFGTGRRASGEPCDHMYALRRSFGLPPYGVPADDAGWPAAAALCEGLDGGKGLDELRGIWRDADDVGRQHFASVVVNVRQRAQRAVDAAATVH